VRVRFERPTLLKVIAFAVIALIMTAGLGMMIANVGLFRDTYTLEAEFEDATGVFKGDAVKVSGVDVGRVTGTRIEKGRAVVEFTVDREVPVTTESVVGIRWRNVIGLRFLYLYPGEGGGEVLGDGDRIPLSRTDSAGDIGEFLNSLGPILQAIDPEKANAFLDAMNTALAGNEAVVRALFAEGATLATDLGAMDEEIQSVISSSDTILSAYANQDDALGAIVDDLDVVGGELATMTDEINALVVSFAAVQEEMDRLLEDNRGNIDASLADLDMVTRTVARNRRRLERTLCTLPQGVYPYAETSSWGERFNVRIGELVVKDSEGNIIASAAEEELPNDGGASDAVVPVVQCPDGTPEQVDLIGPPTHRTGPISAGLAGWLESVSGAADE
jgi:phospholipid/cholesterol/gamma-HCH transport system substrate-binding protein